MGELLKGLKFAHDNEDLLKKIIRQKIQKYLFIGIAIVVGMCLLAGCLLLIFEAVQDKVTSVAKNISSIFSIQATTDGQNFYSFGTSDMQKLENTLTGMGIDTDSLGLDLKSGHVQTYMKAELATGLPKILTDDDKENIQKYIDEYNKTQEDEKGELVDDTKSTDGSNDKQTGVDKVQAGITQVNDHLDDGYRSVTKVGNRVYNNLKQYEGNYSKTPYWGSGTISSSGCGPTSIAICLSGYGQNLTPRNVIDTCGLTYSSPVIMSNALTKLNVKNTLVNNGMGGDDHSVSEDTSIIKNQLKSDKPVMLSLAGGNKFTKGGHYICLLGENDDGSIIVSDPGHNEDVTKNLIAGETIESMLTNYVNAYILIDSDAVDTSGISGTAVMSGKQDFVDGVITVARKDESGNSKDLKYLKADDFNAKVAANDDDVLNYFTLDSNLTMYVATATDTYKNGNLESHKLNKQTIAYKNAVSKYSMPFEFLVAICSITQSPEWVDALANIALKDTTLQIVVQDGHRTTETTEVITIEREVQEKETYTETNEETGESEEHERMVSRTETETQTTVTKVVAGNIVAYLGQVDTWCAKGSLEYVKNDLATTSSSSSRSDDSKVEEPLGSDEEGSRITSYTIDTTINTEVQSYKKGNSTMEVTPDKFLGTLKNAKGEYEVGAKYDKDGKKVLYTDLSGYRKEPIDNILSSPDWLFELLEKSERCQNQETVLKYFLYLYTGRDFGVTEIDPSMFGIDDFNLSSSGSVKGGDAFTKFMQSWENQPLMDYLNGNASYSSYVGKYCSEDKSQYIVHDDGSGNPTVGFGICLKYNVTRFENYGVANVTSNGIGAGIDAAICDKVYAEEINAFREKVLADVSGLDLSQQQIDALTAISYQYGNIGNFVSVYSSYGNTDALRSAFLVNGCTAFLNGYEGNGRRAGANWTLFHEGKYTDQNGNEIIGSSGGGTMAEKAKECHDYIATNNFTYGGGCTIPLSEGNQHVVDCSGFVSWVVYEAGYSQYAGSQKSSYYFESNPDGFEVISYDNIQPGDIMVYSGHVEIYAGTNESGQATVYNAGSNNAINSMTPTYPSRDPSAITIILRPN